MEDFFFFCHLVVKKRKSFVIMKSVLCLLGTNALNIQQ